MTGVYYAPGDRMITAVDGSKRPVTTKAGGIVWQISARREGGDFRAETAATGSNAGVDGRSSAYFALATAVIGYEPASSCTPTPNPG